MEACYCCDPAQGDHEDQIGAKDEKHPFHFARNCKTVGEYCASEEFAGLMQQLDSATEAREKKYITLEEFRDAREFRQIRQLMKHCKYPEDDDSPSGKSFLPVLMLRRCNILIKKPPDYFHYDAALKDLSLLEDNWLEYLPASEHHTLHYLQAFCQIRLNQFRDASDSLRKAEEALEDSNVGEKTAKKRLEKLAKGAETVAANGGRNGEAPSFTFPPSELKLSSHNPDNSALSGSVAAASIPRRSGGGEPTVGIVAKEDIKPGELLALEDALVAVQYCETRPGRSSYASFCHHCLGHSLHTLPCPGCSLVAFCSLGCRDAALGSYHKYECRVGLLHFFNSCRIGQYETRVPITLRYILSRSADSFKELASCSSADRDPIDLPFQADGHPYRDIAALFDPTRPAGEQPFAAAETAVVMAILGATGFLRDCGAVDERPQQYTNIVSRMLKAWSGT